MQYLLHPEKALRLILGQGGDGDARPSGNDGCYVLSRDLLAAALPVLRPLGLEVFKLLSLLFLLTSPRFQLGL